NHTIDTLVGVGKLGSSRFQVLPRPVFVRVVEAGRIKHVDVVLQGQGAEVFGRAIEGAVVGEGGPQALIEVIRVFDAPFGRFDGPGLHEVRQPEAVDVEDVGRRAAGQTGLQPGIIVGDKVEGYVDVVPAGVEGIDDLLQASVLALRAGPTH